MQIEPQHPEPLRLNVNELKAVVDQEPDAVRVGAAWDAVGRVIRALADLAPNHPAISHHTSALAVPVGSRR